MRLQHDLEAPEKPHTPLKLDFVRVGGRYRVGKLLGSGSSGEPISDLSSILPDTSIGSVFSGRDIRTGAEVALKIGRAGQSHSRLNHEYNVYTILAGSAGTSSVLWYGKEGLYEVIVLEYLGNSLGNLVNEKQLNQRDVFSYALQMVCSSSL